MRSVRFAVGAVVSQSPLYTFVQGASVVWAHRSTNLTESGGSVTAIDDLTGNGFNYATLTSSPSYDASGGPGGKPCVTSNGTDQAMRFSWNPAAPATTPIWKLAIWRANGWTTGRVFSNGGGTGLIEVIQTGTTPEVANRNNTLGTPINMTVGQWFAVVEYYAGGSGTDKFRIGSTEITGMTLGNSDPGTFYAIFARATGAAFVSASWCEDLACSGEPSNVSAILTQASRYYGSNLQI